MARSTLPAVHLPPGRPTHGTPAHVIDTGHGIEIPTEGAHRVLLHVRNDGPSAATVTIRGGNRSLSPHGNGEDEHVQVPPLETRFIGPIDVATFTQAGGVIWLDFTRTTVGRISAFRVN